MCRPRDRARRGNGPEIGPCPVANPCLAADGPCSSRTPNSAVSPSAIPRLRTGLGRRGRLSQGASPRAQMAGPARRCFGSPITLEEYHRDRTTPKGRGRERARTATSSTTSGPVRHLFWLRRHHGAHFWLVAILADEPPRHGSLNRCGFHHHSAPDRLKPAASARLPAAGFRPRPDRQPNSVRRCLSTGCHHALANCRSAVGGRRCRSCRKRRCWPALTLLRAISRRRLRRHPVPWPCWWRQPGTCCCHERICCVPCPAYPLDSPS